MIIVPALDLINRKCVRLYQGNYQEVTTYDRDPVSVIRSFEDAGAARIHLVDLDAVRGNTRNNQSLIRKICNTSSCTIEIGGGVRSEEDIERLLDLGVDRIIVGTALARHAGHVAGWIVHFGKIFVAGIDAQDDDVYVEGWEQSSKLRSYDLAKKAEDIFCTSIVYTSIEHDGAMNGPAITEGNNFAEHINIPVILSGGIRNLDDLRLVNRERKAALTGVIVGKALYEGQLDLQEAYREFPQDAYRDVTW